MSDSDDEPIASKRNKKLPPSIDETALSYSDEDQPKTAKIAKQKAGIEAAARKEAKAIRAADAKPKKPAPKRTRKDDSDDEPLSKPKKRQSNGVSRGG